MPSLLIVKLSDLKASLKFQSCYLEATVRSVQWAMTFIYFTVSHVFDPFRETRLLRMKEY